MSEILPPAPSTYQDYRPMEVYVVRPPKPRYALHTLLFLATIFTTLVVGARMEFNFLHNLPVFSLNDDALPLFPVRWALAQPSRVLLGIPFASTLMLILLAHEMGHYLCCRYYGVYATLPFFIPAPTLIGTLGAFIRIRSPIRSRSALFDIGIAGPIASFVLSLITLIFAIFLSKPLPEGMGGSDIQFGYPLIFQLVHRLVGPAQNVPLDQLYLHPIGIAAWVGMFATALYLLPGGQLDGGHIVFSLAPRVHRWVSRLTVVVLIPMGYFLWAGWFVWALLLFISGMRHPQVIPWPGLNRKRKWLA